MNRVEFSKTHGFETVNPGENKVILEIKAPQNYYGFIEAVGNTFYEGCFYVWIIDGQVKEHIYREIGSINKPYRFDPPIMFKDHVKFIGVNLSNQTQVMEVVCEGYFINASELKGDS